MKIIFLSNNEVSMPLFYWLKDEAKEDVKLYSDKLSVDDLIIMKPDLLVSYNYSHIIKEDVIRFMNERVINLHTSLIPWNKGAHPNLWSFLDNTPKGVTIHLVDKGLDTGDILLQKEVEIDEDKETLKTSYKMLHKEMQSLFRDNWTVIKNNQIVPKPQIEKGTMHYMRDFEKIESILKDDGWNIPIYKLKDRFTTV